MRPTYKHTQTGDAILWALGAIAVIAIGAYFSNRNLPVLITVFILLAICGALFCVLNIEIDTHFLKWSFGLGLISKQVALQEIASAEPVNNSWWNGWGIHYTGGGGGWLYNVSGFDAVQITMKDGKRFRLGTDEPEALTAAIRSEIV